MTILIDLWDTAVDNFVATILGTVIIAMTLAVVIAHL